MKLIMKIYNLFKKELLMSKEQRSIKEFIFGFAIVVGDLSSSSGFAEPNLVFDINPQGVNSYFINLQGQGLVEVSGQQFNSLINYFYFKKHLK